jgi:hypothetical protein
MWQKGTVEYQAEEVGGGAACEHSHGGGGCDRSVPGLRMWADGGLGNWVTRDRSVGMVQWAMAGPSEASARCMSVSG